MWFDWDTGLPSSVLKSLYGSAMKLSLKSMVQDILDLRKFFLKNFGYNAQDNMKKLEDISTDNDAFVVVDEENNSLKSMEVEVINIGTDKPIYYNSYRGMINNDDGHSSVVYIPFTMVYDEYHETKLNFEIGNHVFTDEVNGDLGGMGEYPKFPNVQPNVVGCYKKNQPSYDVKNRYDALISAFYSSAKWYIETFYTKYWSKSEDSSPDYNNEDVPMFYANGGMHQYSQARISKVPSYDLFGNEINGLLNTIVMFANSISVLFQHSESQDIYMHAKFSLYEGEYIDGVPTFDNKTLVYENKSIKEFMGVPFHNDSTMLVVPITAPRKDLPYEVHITCSDNTQNESILCGYFIDRNEIDVYGFQTIINDTPKYPDFKRPIYVEPDPPLEYEGIPFEYEVGGSYTTLNLKAFEGGDRGYVGIDWGDGTQQTFDVGDLSSLTSIPHSYADNTVRRVKVYGDFETVNLYNGVSLALRDQVRKVISLGDNDLVDMKDAFKNLHYLEECNVENPNPEGISFSGDCSSMFYYTGRYHEGTVLNLDNSDMSNITNSTSMFLAVQDAPSISVSIRNSIIRVIGSSTQNIFYGVQNVDISNSTLVSDDQSTYWNYIFRYCTDIIATNLTVNIEKTVGLFANTKGTTINVSGISFSGDYVGSLFINCSNLTSIVGSINATNCLQTPYIFSGCESLPSFPTVYTHNNGGLPSAFAYCRSAVNISVSSIFPNINFLENIYSIFAFCDLLVTTDFDSFKNKVNPVFPQYGRVFYYCPNITGVNIGDLQIPDRASINGSSFNMIGFMTTGVANGYTDLLDRLVSHNSTATRPHENGTIEVGSTTTTTDSRETLIYGYGYDITDGNS